MNTLILPPPETIAAVKQKKVQKGVPKEQRLVVKNKTVRTVKKKVHPQQTSMVTGLLRRMMTVWKKTVKNPKKGPKKRMIRKA